jgi:predicted HicB family RNase H-like nuclease
MSNRKVYGFRLEPEIHTAIKIAAAAKGVSMAKWLEAVVWKELKQSKRRRKEKR